MERNNSKSSGDHFDDDIIETGLFKSAGEVINTGLRLPEEEAIKIQQLKTAITEGIESGLTSNFDPKKHLEKMKAAKRSND